MKKLLVMLGLMMVGIVTPQKTHAQLAIAEIIKGAIKKVIKAADLEIQRQQNKVIWLQNAQKTLENSMSKLKLNEISDWTEKQRSLYQDYYQELSKVKAVISYYKRIKDVTDIQLAILKEYQHSRNLFRQDRHFTGQELDFMEKVYSGIIDESLKNLDELQAVVNSFRTQMSDADRLELISEAADRMDATYQDLQAFNRGNITLSLQRAKGQNDINEVRKLYGLQ